MTEADSSPGELYRGIALGEQSGRPKVVANMVVSVDGRAIVDGGAKLLGGPLDRQIMRRLRAAVDCVLVGAATLRAEGYDARVGPEESAERMARGESAQPIAAVVTASGDLPARRGFFRVPDQRRLVLTSDLARARNQERFDALSGLAELVVLPAGAERLEVEQVLDALYRRFAVRRLLVEGGPTLVGELLAANVLDELFLTISPLVVGGEARPVIATGSPLVPPRELRLVSASRQANFLFLRYEVPR